MNKTERATLSPAAICHFDSVLSKRSFSGGCLEKAGFTLHILNFNENIFERVVYFINFIIPMSNRLFIHFIVLLGNFIQSYFNESWKYYRDFFLSNLL